MHLNVEAHEVVLQELESMVERAATQAADFGPEIPDSVFWFATKVAPSTIVSSFTACIADFLKMPMLLCEYLTSLLTHGPALG